jgi:hypothetical protein
MPGVQCGELPERLLRRAKHLPAKLEHDVRRRRRAVHQLPGREQLRQWRLRLQRRELPERLLL